MTTVQKLPFSKYLSNLSYDSSFTARLPPISIRTIPPGIISETFLLSLPVQIKKAQLRYFLQSKLRLHFYRLCGNRKTSLQGLISLSNLGMPNKRKVLCQGFSYQFTEVWPACALVQDIRRDSFKFPAVPLQRDGPAFGRDSTVRNLPFLDSLANPVPPIAGLLQRDGECARCCGSKHLTIWVGKNA